jgi:hypothetical protein
VQQQPTLCPRKSCHGSAAERRLIGEAVEDAERGLFGGCLQPRCAQRVELERTAQEVWI